MRRNPNTSTRAPAALGWLVICGVVSIVAVLLWYLAAFVREMASPNEPYATNIGLSLDQCVSSVRNGLSDEEAYAYCRRSVPKRF